MKIALHAAALAAMTLSTPAFAQEAADTDWFVYVADDESECMAISSPTRAQYFRDGTEVTANTDEPYLTVVYRPGEGAEGQVAYLGGFPFEEDGTVEATVGNSQSQLFTDDIWAWPADPDADAALVSAMRGADELRLSSSSSRGTVVVHFFSLAGFGPAVDEAASRCGG
ncbi:hypothetical protein [Pelagovum pacificum]|uniref:Invasion associated locus B family protein n=1 Tax=Pelagovum pacificum TaxID=2588711 RepID=A0A5C5GHW8_9RHOB|nr:hypothetical protein [Pelagovum pacificum]QQA42669.1 hypothetical protein I8N54_18140 [Pelagovum pacificum]TNY34180.1 hypothetical protein FHY64_13250 [Pelagovum pacificum]